MRYLVEVFFYIQWNYIIKIFPIFLERGLSEGLDIQMFENPCYRTATTIKIQPKMASNAYKKMLSAKKTF